MSETHNFVSQSRSRGLNFTFTLDKEEPILPSISSYQRNATVNLSADLNGDTQKQLRIKRRHASIEFDRDLAISKISMRNKFLSSKISKLNNYWNKKQNDEKRSNPVKVNRKILIFKKIKDPENKSKMRMVTKHMSSEKAALFRQLFKKFIE